MTRLKMSGFEGGEKTVFDTQTGVAASTTYKRTGAYALQVGANTYWAQWVLAGNPHDIYGRIGLYLNADVASPCLISFCDSDGAVQCTLQVNPLTYTLEAYRGATLLDFGGVLNQGIWYCVEFRVHIDAANGNFDVKLDGNLVIDFDGDTLEQADTEIGIIRFGALAPLSAVVCYLDDIAINDDAGAVNNTWIGRGGIHLSKPTGAGTYAEMTPLAGANYAAVDEVPPDEDTTYVQHATAGKRDVHVINDLTPTTGTISAVQWQCRAKLSAAGTGSIKYLLRQADTDYTGADKALDTSYRNVQEILELAPSGVAWTVAIVNEIEAGQQVV
jgi:hypothetical protein